LDVYAAVGTGLVGFRRRSRQVSQPHRFFEHPFAFLVGAKIVGLVSL